MTKTCYIRAGLDIRQVAALTRYYAVVVGQRPNSRNALVSQVVEDFHDVLVRHNLVEPITDIDVALSIMSEFGFTELVHSVRQSKVYLDTITRENLVADKLDKESLDSSTRALAKQLARNL